MAPKVWLVTGSSSGLGLSVVKHALSNGDNVIATLRNPEVLSYLASTYAPTQLLILKLDVTKPEEITSAFAAAHDKFGRVDVVYNNAGFGIISEVESAPDQLVRGMFEVNFWGAANVSREAVRIFRDINSPPGGRLLQTSSVSGVVGSPAGGYYSATKFALVGLSEAIAKEVDPSWNIKIIILDLGGFKTRALDPGVLTIVPPHPGYENTTGGIRAYLSSGMATMGNSDKAGREIHRIANDDGAPLHVALGFDAIGIARNKIEMLTSDVEKSVGYSVDLK
ncbi:NAD(P)-binding protein [Cyathus striatus]|nr:NAD(P)-binding protein [Cyathus striatus]